MTWDQEEDLFNCFATVVFIFIGLFFLWLAWTEWKEFLKGFLGVVSIFLTVAIPTYVCYRFKQWRKK